MTEEPTTHGTCPDCGHRGCYTKWPDGGHFCHSCGSKSKGKSPLSEGAPNLHYDPDITSSETVVYRDLDLDSVRKYGTRTAYNDKGDEVRREYQYPTQIKYRYLNNPAKPGKDFSRNEGFKGNELFGMDLFPAGSSKTLTIVEGEDDAPAAYGMLGSRSPVVSLCSSSISSDLISNCSDYIKSFEQVVICTDADGAGRKAAERLATAFPNRIFLVDLASGDLNDPMDYHNAGKHREFFQAWQNRKKFVPSGFFNTPDQFFGIMSAEQAGTFYPTPIDALNDVIYGLPLGHLVVLTGPEGQGKTEIMRAFEYHMLKNHPEVTIGQLHMEETKKDSLMTLACYALGENVRRPDHKVPQKTINTAIRSLTENHNLFMFDFHIDEDPLAILEKVRYLSVACDCKIIFIDPIQQLAYGSRRDMSEEQVLSQISVQLERLANDLGICIVMTTHVNDDGATRSSRMIGKSASVRIDLTRDHMNPDPDISNITRLSVSKNRPTGKTGYGGSLKFDPDSFTLEEYTV